MTQTIALSYMTESLQTRLSWAHHTEGLSARKQNPPKWTDQSIHGLKAKPESLQYQKHLSVQISVYRNQTNMNKWQKQPCHKPWMKSDSKCHQSLHFLSEDPWQHSSFKGGEGCMATRQMTRWLKGYKSDAQRPACPSAAPRPPPGLCSTLSSLSSRLMSQMA